MQQYPIRIIMPAGGLGDRKPLILAPRDFNLFYIAKNVDFSSGIPKKCKGYTKLNSTPITGDNKITGLHWYKKSGETGNLLCASGTNLWKWTGSAWESFKSGLTTGKRTWFLPFKDTCYIQNDTDTAMKYNGSSCTDWGSGATQAPIGAYPVLHKDRIFLRKNSNKSHIVFSNITADAISEPDKYVATDIMRMREGNNEDISGIVSDGRTLMALKPHHIQYLLGSGVVEGGEGIGWVKSSVYFTDGCYSHDSIVLVGNRLVYYNPTNLISLKQLSRDIFSNVLNHPLDITDTTNRVNPSYRNLVNSVYHNGNLYISYPKGALATENDNIIAYFSQLRLFALWGFGASCWAIDDEEKLYFGSPTDGTVYKFDNVYTFDGEDVEMILQTKYFDLGSPELRKRTDGLFTCCKGNKGTLKIEYSKILDGSDWTTLRTIDLSADKDEILDGDNYYGCRFPSNAMPEMVSIRFTVTSDSYFELYWFTFYTGDTYKKL